MVPKLVYVSKVKCRNDTDSWGILLPKAHLKNFEALHGINLRNQEVVVSVKLKEKVSDENEYSTKL